MADPLQALLAAGAVPTTTFPPTSRYASTSASTRGTRATARRRCRTSRRRFCPRAERFALLYEVHVAEGDRRDMLAARHLGDPELWWRLADANGVVDPRELTDTVGRALRITLPDGRPGAERWLSPRPPPAPDRARACRCRRRARCIDALQRGQGRAGSGETQSGFELTFDALEPLAAAHALPAHRRRRASRSSAS